MTDKKIEFDIDGYSAPHFGYSDGYSLKRKLKIPLSPYVYRARHFGIRNACQIF
jgi:hypothetical protein